MQITIDQKTFDSKGGQMVVKDKEGKKQIFVLQLGGQIFALDNRCPHEGYPLSQGTFDNKSCVLTCNWHNWKFDLKTGKCTLGSDNVKTYPVTLQEGTIQIDVTRPSPNVVNRQITEGLKSAFQKRDYGQIGRELARYIFNDLDPLYGLKQAILWSYDKFAYGMTHAYAGAADWLQYFIQAKERGDREDELISLTEAIDHMAYDALRKEATPFTKKISNYDETLFLKAIEDENEDEAVAMIQGGMESDRRRFGDFKRPLTSAALEHYSDFGHSLIYVYKASQLSSLLDDPDIDLPLLLSLTRSLIYGTREDLLPDFKDYRPTIEKLSKLKPGRGGPDDDKMALSWDTLLGKRVKGSCEWLVEKFPHASIDTLYETLLQANAHNLLHFDMKYQSVGKAGWLDFTHGLTFANAVRGLCSEFPEFWNQGLAQMACFYGRNSKFTMAAAPTTLEGEWKVSDREQFKKDIFSIMTDHGHPLPIYSCHFVKTIFAILEECDGHTQKETQDILLASLNRFLHSPIKGKHVRRSAVETINLVKKDF